jgi:hypothetical protein
MPVPERCGRRSRGDSPPPRPWSPGLPSLRRSRLIRLRRNQVYADNPADPHMGSSNGRWGLGFRCAGGGAGRIGGRQWQARTEWRWNWRGDGRNQRQPAANSLMKQVKSSTFRIAQGPWGLVGRRIGGITPLEAGGTPAPPECRPHRFGADWGRLIGGLTAPRILPTLRCPDHAPKSAPQQDPYGPCDGGFAGVHRVDHH